MPTRNQHYVPRVYLRSWETQVHSRSGLIQGIYLFDKENLSVGEGRNRESVLALAHTYTVDFDHSFICQSCSEILNDFVTQVEAILLARNVSAFYQSIELDSSVIMAEKFRYIEDWEFRYKNSGDLAPKTRILNQIRDIHCYTIEDAFSRVVENDWERILGDFINFAESLPNGRGQIEYQFSNQNVARDMAKMFTFMMSRNPSFDMLGIFPPIKHLVMSAFESSNVTDSIMRGLWLKEIYNGLYGISQGFFNAFVDSLVNHGGFMLLKVANENECFITSDNPAFVFKSNVHSRNRNGLYFPLSPDYLLFGGSNSGSSINNLIIRTISGDDLRLINSIIIDNSTRYIVSSKRNIAPII